MITGIKFTPSGEREFIKLPPAIQKRIIEKIRLYLSTDNPLYFAKSLVNLPPATHRFRIGKYRICFYIETSYIVIDTVNTREDAYRRN